MVRGSGPTESHTFFSPDILIPQVKTEVEAIVGEDGLERERVDGSAVLSTVA